MNDISHDQGNCIHDNLKLNNHLVKLETENCHQNGLEDFKDVEDIVKIEADFSKELETNGEVFEENELFESDLENEPPKVKKKRIAKSESNDVENSDKTNSCDVCGKIFSTSTLLNIHYRNVSFCFKFQELH